MDMQIMDGALQLLSDRLREVMVRLGTKELESVNEIRIRLNKPLTLTVRSGHLVPDIEIRANREDIDTVVSRAFRNSLHSNADRLCAGFVTYENGCRVGLAGTAALADGRVVNIKHISSICIRLPREIKGISDGIYEHCCCAAVASVLICGAPCSGKTTYLRDLTRCCGNRSRTALIDERGELAAVSNGKCTNDVGLLTDVYDGYPRKTAIESAIRSMSPEVIVCDEIGSDEDVSSLAYAAESGVKLIASCHCGSIEGLMRKPNISKLIKDGMFEHIVFLEGLRVKSIIAVGELLCSV